MGGDHLGDKEIILLDLSKTGFEVVNLTEIDHDHAHCSALVLAVLNLQIL
jgi:hypothetical protein